MHSSSFFILNMIFFLTQRLYFLSSFLNQAIGIVTLEMESLHIWQNNIMDKEISLNFGLYLLYQLTVFIWTVSIGWSFTFFLFYLLIWKKYKRHSQHSYQIQHVCSLKCLFSFKTTNLSLFLKNQVNNEGFTFSVHCTRMSS